jgi:hypothetical protein
MADAVATVTEAPKAAFKWASSHLMAFAVVLFVLLLLFVAIESRKPGQIASKVSKIPVLGDWALNRKTA